MSFEEFKEWAEENLNVESLLNTNERGISPSMECKQIFESLADLEITTSQVFYVISYSWWDSWYSYIQRSERASRKSEQFKDFESFKDRIQEKIYNLHNIHKTRAGARDAKSFGRQFSINYETTNRKIEKPSLSNTSFHDGRSKTLGLEKSQKPKTTRHESHIRFSNHAPFKIAEGVEDSIEEELPPDEMAVIGTTNKAYESTSGIK